MNRRDRIEVEIGSPAPLEVLPGGRHQLPPETVRDHQHRRLIAAMAGLCAERGYAHVVISDIVARAAVSKTAFYRLFRTKDECLFEAHKYYSATLLAEIDGSCSREEDWPLRLRGGVRAALEFCVSSPEAAQLLTLGILSCGPIGIERYRVMIGALANRLRAGGEVRSRRHADAALAAVVFAAPLISSSVGEGDPDAILTLESDFVEMILAFSAPGG